MTIEKKDTENNDYVEYIVTEMKSEIEYVKKILVETAPDIINEVMDLTLERDLLCRIIANNFFKNKLKLNDFGFTVIYFVLDGINYKCSINRTEGLRENSFTIVYGNLLY